MRIAWIATFAAVAALSLTGPAFAYKKVRCFNLHPPEEALRGVKRIAVLDFEGEKGRTASDRLVSALLEDRRGIYDLKEKNLLRRLSFRSSTQEGRTHQKWATTRIFDIVERSRIEQVMREQQFQQTGAVDNAQVVNLGKILGVDAILTGSVSHEHSDNRTTEKRKIKRSKKEGGDYEGTVECLERKVTVNLKMRILSIETGQILGNKEVIHTKSDRQCDKDIGAIASVAALLDSCITTEELIAYIAPHFEPVEIELQKVQTKQYENRADEAAEWAEKGDVDRAYLIYSAIFQEDAYNPEVLYNLGVLNEAAGNFADAKEKFQSALTLKSDEKDYQDALARVQKSLDFAEVLKGIGLPVTKHEWGADASEVAEVTAQRVVVKGSGSDRQEIKQEPKSDSLVAARVPGGIELVVLAKEGDWFRVKLGEGKEGYLHISQVK